jgi:hypothetical protein
MTSQEKLLSQISEGRHIAVGLDPDLPKGLCFAWT